MTYVMIAGGFDLSMAQCWCSPARAAQVMLAMGTDGMLPVLAGLVVALLAAAPGGLQRVLHLPPARLRADHHARHHGRAQGLAYLITTATMCDGANN